MDELIAVIGMDVMVEEWKESTWKWWSIEAVKRLLISRGPDDSTP